MHTALATWRNDKRAVIMRISASRFETWHIAKATRRTLKLNFCWCDNLHGLRCGLSFPYYFSFLGWGENLTYYSTLNFAAFKTVNLSVSSTLRMQEALKLISRHLISFQLRVMLRAASTFVLSIFPYHARVSTLYRRDSLDNEVGIKHLVVIPP